MTELSPKYVDELQSARLGQNLVYFYYVLGAVVIAGLVLALVLGFRGVVGPGLFTGETAFAVAGIAMTVLSGALVVLLFTLGVTIYRIRVNLARSIRLREAIEGSYERLEEATHRLALQLPRLRTVLYDVKREAAESRTSTQTRPRAPASVAEATDALKRDLHQLRGLMTTLKDSTPGNQDPSRN